MTFYTDRKPREAVARAIEGVDCSGLPLEVACQRLASIALTRLRQLGFITSEGLDAIHAEEDANGEPRSSVVPGSGR